MDPFAQPTLPAPKIPDNYQKLTSPHFSTPAGMLLPRGQQPPPMFGLRGATVPGKHLPEYNFERMQPYRKEIRQPNPMMYCDICDRAYPNEDKLERHRVQAHPELLGITPRVYSAEEVNAWKDERKKRYPTTQNVLNRQKAKEERQQRGERLHERNSRFGHPQDRRQMSQPQTQRTGKARKRPNKKVFNVKVEEQTEDVLDGLRRFGGTAQIKDYERTVVVRESTALSCLGDYGSETDEESDGEPLEMPIERVTEPEVEVSVTNENDEEPMEVPIEKDVVETCSEPKKAVEDSTPHNSTVEINISNTATESTSRHRKRKRPNAPTAPKSIPTLQRRYRKYQNTLLEKLLAPDILHERNVLLQCVRFVVQNNCFDIGKDKK